MTSHVIPSYLSKDDLGPWGMYLQQVDRVTPYLGELAYWVETLKRPKRILIVDVPIEMDDGTVAHFEGYRVQHNTSRGPGKGGVRFHQDVTLYEVMALAGLDDDQERRGRTCPSAAPRAACASIRAGSRWSELERITRRYTSEIGIIIGPDKDIPAPDVNTNEQIMAWMMDTYSMNHGAHRHRRGHRQADLAGRHPRARARPPGRGVFVVGRGGGAAASGCRLDGARVVRAGLRQRRRRRRPRCSPRPARKVDAVQDYTGTIHNPRGLDVAKLIAHGRRAAGGDRRHSAMPR